jgi:hypothetical protein
MEDDKHRPADTREFLGMWHAVTDQHFIEQLNLILPGLLRDVGPRDPAATAVLAGRLLQALRLAAGPGGDLSSAIRYLKEAADQPAPRNE